MPPNFRGENFRCVNCGIAARGNVPQVGQLLQAERQLLSTWLQSYDIPDFDISWLCLECAAYVRKYAIQADSSEMPPRWLGHDNVCATCGLSTKRTRAITVDEHGLMRPYHETLQPYLQLYKEGKAKICLSCDLKAKRLFAKTNKPPQVEIVYNEENPEIQEQVLKLEKPEQYAVKAEENVDKSIEIVKTLTIKTYWKLEVPKKLACIACGGAEVGRVRLKTRQQLMLRYKLYIPSGARVCALHSDPGAWSATYTQPCEFTPEEIADMIFLLKFVYPADLADVENLPTFTRKKWLGVTLEKFNEILSKTPKLLERNDGRFALAVYLANKNSGECMKVLASICERPLELIQSAVELARECVDLDTLTKSSDKKTTVSA